MQRNEVVDLQKFRNGDADAALAQEDTHYLAAGTRLLVGQYKIEGYLNCGGFGITYTARDSLGRKVVIKECFPSEMVYRRGKSMVSRSPKYAKELTDIVHHFVTEAHSLANARHNNVVHVHQIFEENATAYMAMDFIDGPDLLDIVDSDQTLTPRQVELITRKMLEAIRYVHDRGMLHRDISPDNILIEKSGEPVLIDFGAARLPSHRKTGSMPRMKCVKDGYSPQEFYVADSVHGPASDLYALAASIYHLITGAAPPDAQSRLAAIAAKKPDPYAPLAKEIKGYPLRFLKAIDTALAVLPEDRFQSAAEWQARIGPRPPEQKTRLLAPVTAVMESLSVFDDGALVEQVKATPDNRKRLAASAAAVALLIGGGAIFLLPKGPERVPGNGPDALSTAPALASYVAPENAGPDALPQRVADLPVKRSFSALLPLDMASSPVFEVSSLSAEWQNFAAPEAPAQSAVQVPSLQDHRPTGDALALFTTAAPQPPQTPFTAIDPANPQPVDTAPLGVELVSLAPIARYEPRTLIAGPTGDAAAVADTAAPNYVPPIEATYSRWDVDLPFRAEPLEQEGQTGFVIRDLDRNAAQPESADWLAEGGVILAINSAPLAPNQPLGAQLVSPLNITRDGTIRAEIWYRKPSEEVLDQGVLVVPVIRATKLADGTRLETRQQGESWVTRVIELGVAQTDLQVGDLIIGNAAGSTRFADPATVEAALDALSQSGITAVEFSVLRRGTRLTAAWAYAEE